MRRVDIWVGIGDGIAIFLTGWAMGRRWSRRRREAEPARRASTKAWKEIEMLADKLHRIRTDEAHHGPDGRTE